MCEVRSTCPIKTRTHKLLRCYRRCFFFVKRVAVTGISLAIKAMVTKFHLIPDNQNMKVFIMAPMGKAAIAADGFNIHSNLGLSLQFDAGQRSSYRELLTAILIKMQERFKDNSAVVIENTP